MSKRWMSTGFVTARPTGEVNHDEGTIQGVSVCTVGEASGHGVNLDHEFIERVAEFGNEKKQGLKARFGHPTMCSTALGTFLGRFKNFAVTGDQVRADLFLSNEAKDTPHGNLYDYVCGMASNEPDMFGTSIVFTPGRYYKRKANGEKIYEPGWNPEPDETGDEYQARRDEYRETPGPEYVECAELHGCDAVDDPAANDGLFSRFSQESVAGQITEFLDLHPQVWTAVQNNPTIIGALAQYGDRVDEFITRYRDYRANHKEHETMTDEPTNSEKLEDTELHDVKPEPPAEPEATEETPEAEATAAEPATEEPEAAAEETAPASDEPVEAEAEAPEEDAALSRAEFTRIADEFGAEIAAQTVRDGGDYSTALRAYADSLAAENETLRGRVAELESLTGTKPVKVVEKKEKASLFNSGK